MTKHRSELGVPANHVLRPLDGGEARGAPVRMQDLTADKRALVRLREEKTRDAVQGVMGQQCAVGTGED